MKKTEFKDVMAHMSLSRVDKVFDDEFYKPFGWTQTEFFDAMRSRDEDRFMKFITAYTTNTNDEWVRHTRSKYENY